MKAAQIKNLPYALERTVEEGTILINLVRKLDADINFPMKPLLKPASFPSPLPDFTQPNLKLCYATYLHT